MPTSHLIRSTYVVTRREEIIRTRVFICFLCVCNFFSVAGYCRMIVSTDNVQPSFDTFCVVLRFLRTCMCCAKARLECAIYPAKYLVAHNGDVQHLANSEPMQPSRHLCYSSLIHIIVMKHTLHTLPDTAQVELCCELREVVQ